MWKDGERVETKTLYFAKGFGGSELVGKKFCWLSKSFFEVLFTSSKVYQNVNMRKYQMAK